MNATDPATNRKSVDLIGYSQMTTKMQIHPVSPGTVPGMLPTGGSKYLCS